MLRSARKSRPKVTKAWYGYVDGGGTNTRVGIAEVKTDRSVFLRTYESAKYASLAEIVGNAFEGAGGAPARTVFALAGPVRPEERSVLLTNRPGWPEVRMGELEAMTGSLGVLVNDVELLAAGAAASPTRFLSSVRDGSLKPGGRLLAVTWSTGINAAILDRGRTFGLEMGYSRDVPPRTEDEASFVRFIADATTLPYGFAELVLSGGHGIDMAPDWMAALGEKPSPETAHAMEQLRAAGKHDVGPAITNGMTKDPYCARIMRTIGGLYGTFLHQMMVEFRPTGGVHLAGAINQNIVLALADPKYSPMLDRIDETKLPYAREIKNIPIYLNRDTDIMRRGARQILGL